MVSLIHHEKTFSLNLTQVTYLAHHTHIYVSLLGYLVPHHHLPIQLPLHLLHVHLRWHLRVLLCGEEKGGSISVWVLKLKPKLSELFS